MNPEELFSNITAVLIVLGVVSALLDGIYPWDRRSNLIKWLFVTVLAAVTVIPIGGLSLSALLLSINPNYSVGLAVLLLVFTAQRLFGLTLLSSRDLSFFALWNITLGVVLYAGALGFLPYDIYYMGYYFSPLFLVICGLTVVLVSAGSRLEWLFISYIAFYNLGLLPSPNFFDYMIDPFLFLVSIGIIVSKVSR